MLLCGAWIVDSYSWQWQAVLAGQAVGSAERKWSSCAHFLSNGAHVGPLG